MNSLSRLPYGTGFRKYAQLCDLLSTTAFYRASVPFEADDSSAGRMRTLLSAPIGAGTPQFRCTASARSAIVLKIAGEKKRPKTATRAGLPRVSFYPA